MSVPTMDRALAVLRLPRDTSRRATAARAAFRDLGRRLTPAQSLALGFSFLTLAGAVLLTFPVASARGAATPFIDAFFTASSAITTTGLAVVDTGSHYSLFGQLIILTLFQVGGLGYMALIAFLAYLIGSKPSFRGGMTLQESIAGTHLGELKDFVRSVILFTAAFEAFGALVLAQYWAAEFPLPKALYLGMFHSVSAFATAGFGLFADSFTSARDSVVVNLTIALVTIAGGIGFFVLRDLSTYAGKLLRGVRPRRLSMHTHLVVVASATLMVLGSVLVFVAEHAAAPAPVERHVLEATFQALSASTTTGFNTVDIGKMTPTSLFGLIILMFVGSSPGGTGGGIKTTTLGVVLMSVVAMWKGDQDTVVFRRKIPLDTVWRALAIGMAATALVALDTIILTATEDASFLSIVFEVVSAFGTVGLSMGITPDLSIIGKLVISFTMLIGRMGPLAIGFALIGASRRARFRYVEGRVYVG